MVICISSESWNWFWCSIIWGIMAYGPFCRVCLYKYRVIVLIASRTERKLFQSMVCGTLFVFCPSPYHIFMPQNCVRCVYTLTSGYRIVVLLFVEFSYMHKSFSCMPNAVYIQCIDKCMLWNLEFEFILWFVVQRNEFPVGCRAANNSQTTATSKKTAQPLFNLIVHCIQYTKQRNLWSLSLESFNGCEIST